VKKVRFTPQVAAVVKPPPVRVQVTGSPGAYPPRPLTLTLATPVVVVVAAVIPVEVLETAKVPPFVSAPRVSLFVASPLPVVETI
jgi:hypothetical protein